MTTRRTSPKATPTDILVLAVALLSLVGATVIALCGDAQAMAPLLGALTGVGLAGISYELLGGRRSGMQDADFSWGKADSLTRFRVGGPPALMLFVAMAVYWGFREPYRSEIAAVPEGGLERCLGALDPSPTTWRAVERASGAPVAVRMGDTVLTEGGVDPLPVLHLGDLSEGRWPLRATASTGRAVDVGAIQHQELVDLAKKLLPRKLKQVYKPFQARAGQAWPRACKGQGDLPFKLVVEQLDDDTSVALSACTGEASAVMTLRKGVPRELSPELLPDEQPHVSLVVIASDHTKGEESWSQILAVESE